MPPPPKKAKVKSDGNGAEKKSEDPSVAASAGDIITDEDAAAKRTLFIRSLDYATTSEKLTTHFSYAGPIKHATVVADPTTKASRGFGFVTFVDPADAQSAIKEFNGKVLGGRHIKVEIAQPRHRDAAAGASKPPSVVAQAKDVKRRSPRLIVRNLPWSIKKPEQLEVYFRMYGKVKSIIIPRKNGKATGPMSGFAIITMRNTKNAERAIAGVNGTEIDKRTVAVDWAVEKDEWKKARQDDEDGDKPKVGVDLEADRELGEGDTDDEGDEDESSAGGSDQELIEDEDDEDAMDEDEDGNESKTSITNNYDESTVFIRNLAFTTEEDGLYQHFSSTFGPVRYARIVMDHATERPRGTAFVCFYNTSDCDDCLKEAPRSTVQKADAGGKQSILQSDDLDPTGKYTLDGRVLSLTKAVSRDQAEKLTVANSNSRDKAQRDRRHLYLLTEGTIPSNSPMFATLSKKEVALREASLQQRKSFVEKNPSLHMSLTRLSVRNIPRNIDEKALKQLARKAVVEFASEVKKGARKPLSKEELSRGGPEMREEEKRRKAQGKGIVKQAKLVKEDKGAGRSKGYGFIEYFGHRWALMGLRWMNAREVASVTLPDNGGGEKAEQVEAQKGKKKGKGNGKGKGKEPEKSEGSSGQESFPEDRKKRLIVEFALENVQVVNRRRDKEDKARQRSKEEGQESHGSQQAGKKQSEREKGKPKGKVLQEAGSARKRKRDSNDSGDEETHHKAGAAASSLPGDAASAGIKESKSAKASRIIARKRQLRRAKQKGTRR